MTTESMLDLCHPLLHILNLATDGPWGMSAQSLITRSSADYRIMLFFSVSSLLPSAESC